MILQLDPPLPMDTVRGAGLAHFMIDYGPEAHLMWVVFLKTDGACWTVPNPEVRLQANWSMQRRPAQGAFEQPTRIQMAGVEARKGDDGQATSPGPGLNGNRLNGEHH
ncbi:hypothetical protein [Pararoseomonas baculiformis]|nr:hypothetical protein [Pararoseomonas baculiformis]